jgi:hypothetical protein
MPATLAPRWSGRGEQGSPLGRRDIDAASAWVIDVSEDDFRQLDHKPSKPGILLTQRINVFIMFAGATRRLILPEGIFKKRRSVVGRFTSPKRGFAAASLVLLWMIYLHN